MPHFVFSKEWRDQERARDRERKREHKAKAVYGVFQHSSGKSGGYVAIEGWKLDYGGYAFPSPYNDATPVRIYTSRSAAEKHAYKMTFG